ncbi:N-acetyltransferase [Streptomyces nigrescens]|uniref:N-acetyltransferase n=2 Tax=Streptomyces TaxID=1883 RepID=A0ABM7ZMP0_STRNI|nr:N-acetyltransferase [Streptomyces nigrescens]MEE4421872.1 N-acetyltransferase [Streptomyces sp. DSM 41528]BDM67649.1 N-acetyltransferase [Streptomyces nigrescens]
MSSSASADDAPEPSTAASPSTAARSPWRARPEAAADIPAVRRINLAAFETAEEADLVDALRRDRSAWLPGLSYVADAPDGTPAAHALLTRCHVDDVPAVALAPCAVLPAHQKSGAGSAVIRALLDAARAAGERTALVLGHPPYYPRFGFAPAASRFGILPPQPWPDEAFLALSLDGSTPPRGTVRYATPFGID